MANKINDSFRKDESSFFRTLNISKNFFLSQFSISKIFVALIIVVVALLGPIIQLSTRDLLEQQQNKIAIFLSSPEVKHVVNGIPGFDRMKLDDAFINDLIQSINDGTITLPPSISTAALEQLTIKALSWSMLGQVFSSSILYALASGIFFSIRDRKSVDRVRVMYINYSKHKILFFKVLMESLMFLFIVVTADTMGMILVQYVGNGSFSNKVITQLVIQLLGMFVFYFFIQMGLKFITSRIESKNIKAVVMGAWLLSTAFLYVVLSIVLGVIQEATTTIVDNKLLFALIPVANIVVLPLVLYGLVDLWMIVPIIVYMMIGIGLVWKSTSSHMKNFLCS